MTAWAWLRTLAFWLGLLGFAWWLTTNLLIAFAEQEVPPIGTTNNPCLEECHDA